MPQEVAFATTIITLESVHELIGAISAGTNSELSPDNTLNVIDSDPEEIKKLQKALGMKDDDIDGIWSEKTEKFLKKHLKKNEK